jgi:hypothetical protein
MLTQSSTQAAAAGSNCGVKRQAFDAAAANGSSGIGRPQILRRA